MDLFEVGFAVSTAEFNSAMRTAKSELFALNKATKEAVAAINNGFQGNAVSARNLGLSLAEVDKHIANTKRTLTNLGKAGNVDTRAVKAAQDLLKRLQEGRAEVSRVYTEWAAHERHIQEAVRTRGAVEKRVQSDIAKGLAAQQAAEIALERQEASNAAARQSRDNARAASLANIDRNLSSQLTIQADAQRLLGAGLAANTKEALSLATALERARLAGASPEQLTYLEARILKTNEAAAATALLGKQQAEQAAAAAAAAKLSADNATVVATAGKIQAASFERSTLALNFMRKGLVQTRAEAERLAGTYLKLKAAGMSTSALGAWTAKQQQIGALSTEMNKLAGGMNRTGSAFKNFEHNVTRMRTGLFSVLSIIGILGFDKLIRGLFDTAKSMNTIERSLNMLTGSVEGTAQATSDLRNMADRLGVSYTVLADSATKFGLAAKGQLTWKQSLDIFEGVSMGLRAMGKDTVDSGRAFKALEQMAGKGVISMEELRGQLAESLPSAIRVMSSSMGMLPSKFMKLVAQGLVPASDALIKFGAAMKLENAEAARQAANSLSAAVDKLGNSFTYLYMDVLNSGSQQKLLDSFAALNKALQDPATKKAIADLLTGIVNLMKFLAENASLFVTVIQQAVKLGAVFLTYSAVVKVLTSLSVAFKGIELAQAAIILRGDAVAAMGVLMGVSFSWVTVVAVAIAGIAAAMIYMGGSTDDAADSSKNLEGGIKALTDAEIAAKQHTEEYDAAMLALNSTLKTSLTLHEDVAAAVKNRQAYSAASKELRAKGYTEDQIGNMDRTSLEKTFLERAERDKQIAAAVASRDKLQSDMAEKSKFWSEDRFNPKWNTEYADYLSKLEIENSRIEHLTADRAALVQDWNKIVAMGLDDTKQKDLKKDEAKAKATSSAATNELVAYQDRLTTSIYASKVAVELYNSGQVASIANAEELGQVIAKYRAKGMSVDDPQVKSKLEEIRINQQALDQVREQISNSKKLKEEENKRLDIANETVIINSLYAKGATAREDVKAIAELVNRRMLEKGVSMDNLKIREKLTDEARAQLNEERKIGEQAAFNAKITEGELAIKQKQLQLSLGNKQLSGGLDMRADVGRIAELFGTIENGTKVTLDRAIELERAERGITAQLQAQAVAASDVLDRESDRWARAAAANKNFSVSRMDARAVGAQAELLKQADPNLSDEAAVQQAVNRASAIDQMTEATNRFAESTRTVGSLWSDLFDSWNTGTPLVTQMAQAFTDAADTARNQLGDAIASIALDMSTAREAAKSLAQTIARELISSLVKTIATAAMLKLKDAFGWGNKKGGNGGADEEIKAIQKKTVVQMASIGMVAKANLMALQGITAAASQAATALAVAWYPAALYSAIATGGASVAVATGALSTALAAGMAATTGMAAATAAGGVAGKQTGGPVNQNTPYMVGEAGRELFVPQTDGRILSHTDTMKVLGKSADIIDFQSRASVKRAQTGASVSAGQTVMAGEAGGELFVPRGTAVSSGRGGSSPITVKVINNLGVESRVDVTDTEEAGQRFVTIALNAVAEDIAKNGRVGQALRSKYNVKQRLGGRS